MSTIISATVDTSELDALMKRATPSQVTYAIRRGLNDSIRQGRTVSRKAARERYNIPLSRLTSGRADFTRIKWARSNNLEAGLLANTSRSVNLADFQGSTGGGGRIVNTRAGRNLRRGRKNLGRPLTGRKAKPVKVRLLKGGTKKQIDGAFVAKMKSGHIGIFGRGWYRGTGSFIFAPKGQKGKFQELGAMTLYKALVNDKVEREIMAKMKSAMPRRTSFWIKRQLGLV